jgi:hypothetical protein
MVLGFLNMVLKVTQKPFNWVKKPEASVPVTGSDCSAAFWIAPEGFGSK